MQDLWHIYNLVRETDLVRSSTYRKVSRESASGATDTEKIKLNLEVQVVGEVRRVHAAVRLVTRKGVHILTCYWCSPNSTLLRTRSGCVGKIRPTPHVRMNSFHTLELDVNRKLTLTKELWDEVTL